MSILLMAALLAAPQQIAKENVGWYCLAEELDGQPRDPMLITRLNNDIKTYLPTQTEPGLLLKDGDMVTEIDSDAMIEFDVKSAWGIRDRWRVAQVGENQYRLTIHRYNPGSNTPMDPVTGQCRRVL